MPLNPQPFLNGQLISLRPLKAEDRESLFAAASDPLIWEQHPQRDRYQRNVFDAFFDEAMQSDGALLALDAKSGQTIGTSRYYDRDPAGKSVAIGYTFLIRACWGGGYNREMKELMLGHAFRSVESVFFHVGEDNARSRKAMEKIGAKPVGKVDRKLADGSLSPSIIFEIKARAA